MGRKAPFLALGVFRLLRSSCFLFLPQPYLVRFGLFEFSQKNHVWFAIAFLGTAIFLCTYPIAWVYKKTTESIQRKQFLRQGKDMLRNLSPDEKALLARFVRANGSVLNLDIMSGTVRVLSAHGFIFQASNLGRLMRGFPHKIQPWVLAHLKAHPECLQ